MRHKQIIPARFEQGQRAYAAGHNVDHVFHVCNEIEQMHYAEGVTEEQHHEIENSIPSFIAGFASGLIDDIRAIAGQRRGQRA